MATSIDIHELWVGTPNEMALLMRGRLAEIKTRAKKELVDRREMADKYDHAAIPGLNEASEGINALTPLSFKNGPRTWMFPFIGIKYRIEVR